MSFMPSGICFARIILYIKWYRSARHASRVCEQQQMADPLCFVQSTTV